MALHVNTSFSSNIKNDPYQLVKENAGGEDIFLLPDGYTKVDVYRDAGIIYEGSNPDQYILTKNGNNITSVKLNTALTNNENLKINAFK